MKKNGVIIIVGVVFLAIGYVLGLVSSRNRGDKLYQNEL